MNAYLPNKFLQVFLHNQTGTRLNAFLQLLKKKSYTPCVGCDLLDTNDGLLVLLTRRKVCPFGAVELDHVKAHVKAGRPLLHMSNHPPLTRNDSQLGKVFGYSFKGEVLKPSPTAPCAPQPFDVPSCPNSSVFAAVGGTARFAICNGCEVRGTEAFEVIARYGNSSTSTAPFAIARNSAPNAGKIVAMGDSGLVGEPIRCNPGPGLKAGDNRLLMGCILSWLRS